MAEGLPEGLVRTREGVTAVEEGVDRVDVNLVASCWSVYSSNKALLAENVGRRLENFFWRIWSSERLRQRLSGTQVNILFEIISQGGYIRTTPTASPRSSKSLSAYYKEARLRTPPTTPPVVAEPTARVAASDQPETSSSNANAGTTSSAHPLSTSPAAITGTSDDGAPSKQSVSGDRSMTPHRSATSLEKLSKARPSSSDRDGEDNSLTPTPTSPLAALGQVSGTSKENRRTPFSATRRPPILKKGGSSGSSRSSKSAKIAFPSSGESEASVMAENECTTAADDPTTAGRMRSSSARRPVTTRFNEEVAVSIPKPSSSVPRTMEEQSIRSGESSQRSGRRNPVVVASTATNRTKPSFARQRSSMGTTREVPSRSPSSQQLAKSPKQTTVLLSKESQSQMKVKPSPESLLIEQAQAASPLRLKQHPTQDLPFNQDYYQNTGYGDSEIRTSVEKTTVKSIVDETGLADLPSKRAGNTKSLVDPDFRARFIDRTRASQRSLTDISSLTRKSSAAVPTTASFQAAGMMNTAQASTPAGRGKGREAFTNVTAPLKAPAPAGPEEVGDANTLPLPRTKSQLTLLLEKERVKEEKISKPPDR